MNCSIEPPLERCGAVYKAIETLPVRVELDVLCSLLKDLYGSASKETDQSRALLTLMGGLGYIKLRDHLDDPHISHANDSDAHVVLVVWEIKL